MEDEDDDKDEDKDEDKDKDEDENEASGNDTSDQSSDTTEGADDLQESDSDPCDNNIQYDEYDDDDDDDEDDDDEDGPKPEANSSYNNQQPTLQSAHNRTKGLQEDYVPDAGEEDSCDILHKDKEEEDLGDKYSEKLKDKLNEDMHGDQCQNTDMSMADIEYLLGRSNMHHYIIQPKKCKKGYTF